jgi:hypothetical protein
VLQTLASNTRPYGGTRGIGGAWQQGEWLGVYYLDNSRGFLDSEKARGEIERRPGALWTKLGGLGTLARSHEAHLFYKPPGQPTFGPVWQPKEDDERAAKAARRLCQTLPAKMGGFAFLFRRRPDIPPWR